MIELFGVILQWWDIFIIGGLISLLVATLIRIVIRYMEDNDPGLLL